VKSGVRIAYGTDIGEGDHAMEFNLMIANGLSPARAILAATHEAADLLGAAGPDRFRAGGPLCRLGRARRQAARRPGRVAPRRVRHEGRHGASAQRGPDSCRALSAAQLSLSSRL